MSTSLQPITLFQDSLPQYMYCSIQTAKAKKELSQRLSFFVLFFPLLARFEPKV
jgi:hypothetical protein